MMKSPRLTRVWMGRTTPNGACVFAVAGLSLLLLWAPEVVRADDDAPKGEGASLRQDTLDRAELAERTYTKNQMSMTGLLRRYGDGRLWLQVALAPGVDRDALVRSHQLLATQVKGADPGTYLRPFSIAMDGPTEPMLKRRIGHQVELSLVQDQKGHWVVADIRTVELRKGSSAD
ncbi:MAG: hypothetical protein H6729_00245 [Deltaproteobacteria bacterium]|nr:hypothetical protein [Deltaproteobacteria bacterium]